MSAIKLNEDYEISPITGHVSWILGSGRRVASGVQVPPVKDVKDPKGVAELLRQLAVNIETLGHWGDEDA